MKESYRHHVARYGTAWSAVQVARHSSLIDKYTQMIGCRPKVTTTLWVVQLANRTWIQKHIKGTFSPQIFIWSFIYTQLIFFTYSCSYLFIYLIIYFILVVLCILCIIFLMYIFHVLSFLCIYLSNIHIYTFNQSINQSLIHWIHSFIHSFH